MTQLILSTGNAHKVAEIKSILGPRFRYYTLKDLPGAPAIAEDAGTFAGNATKKASGLAEWLAATDIDVADVSAPDRILVMADDSGLEVDALGGAPGVRSARFAAPAGSDNSSDGDNNAKLLRLLEDVPMEKRTARFRCVIALSFVPREERSVTSPVCDAGEAELRTELFDGTCEGKILFEPRGTGGFGYDPLFVPDGNEQSFAELGEDVKNRISHRAKALTKLRERLMHSSS